MENILITGASTGIGYSLCNVFLNNSCQVIGTVRKEEDATRLSADLGERFHPIIMDVTDHEAVHQSVDQVKAIIGDGGLSCLVNNAGIAVGGPMMYLDMELYRKQLDVNFFGVIAVTKAYLPLLGAVSSYKHTPGKILNISSISAQISFPFLSAYCASKSALEAFGDSLRREMLLYGIDVINIEPGPIKTPIWNKTSGLPPEVMDSDFGPALKKFLNQTRKSEEGGMEADALAEKIYRVCRKKKSKVRYVFMNKKLSNFLIPRYFMNPRLFDRFVKKMFFSN